MKSRRILVTSALPYANGSIHLGHLVEYLQTDIWARFQKMCGHECYYVCADDAHGTPIMIRAQQEGITPEELIAKTKLEHEQDFADFHIEFDNYHSTHSEENKYFATTMFAELQKNGYISTRTVTDLFDPDRKRYSCPTVLSAALARNAKPKISMATTAKSCGATYTPSELINPRSAISGAEPIQKENLHYFFQLSKMEKELREWTQSKGLQPEIANKLQEWFTDGLQDWDISRDAPYFGFEIPDAPGKYFYVWLDAPIGYMASFQKLFATNVVI